MLKSDADDSASPMHGDTGAARMIPLPTTSAPVAFTPRAISHADQRDIGQLHGSKYFPQTQTMQHPQPSAATVKSKKKSQRVRFWDEIGVPERDAGDSDTDSGDALGATLTRSRGVGAVADTALDRSQIVGAPDAALSEAQRTIARLREDVRLLRQQRFEKQFESRREASAAAAPGSTTQLQNLQQALNRCVRFVDGINW